MSSNFTWKFRYFRNLAWFLCKTAFLRGLKFHFFKIRGPEIEFSNIAYFIELVAKSCLFEFVVSDPVPVKKVEIFEIFEILLDFCWKIAYFEGSKISIFQNSGSRNWIFQYRLFHRISRQKLPIWSCSPKSRTN